MSISVFIDGAAGTTGLEIRERLERPRGYRAARARRAAPQGSSVKREEALNSADFVILCLPDDAAREAVAMIRSEQRRGDRRIDRAPRREDWVYGFAELEPGQAAAIAEAAGQQSRLLSHRFPGAGPPADSRRADPARFPSHRQRRLGLFGRRQVDDRRIRGQSAKGFTETAFRAYGLRSSTSMSPEMQKHARIEHPPIFLPAVAVRTYRGMVVEVPLPLHAFTRKPSLEAAIETALRDAYKDSPVVGARCRRKPR
jgi:N-acetyl-gamma-glutamyl-phosphate reductase